MHELEKSEYGRYGFLIRETSLLVRDKPLHRKQI
jgi:hypothetical protein